jgi:hypothetical protein
MALISSFILQKTIVLTIIVMKNLATAVPLGYLKREIPRRNSQKPKQDTDTGREKETNPFVSSNYTAH